MNEVCLRVRLWSDSALTRSPAEDSPLGRPSCLKPSHIGSHLAPSPGHTCSIQVVWFDKLPSCHRGGQGSP
jgi:hypothetical protein